MNRKPNTTKSTKRETTEAPVDVAADAWESVADEVDAAPEAPPLPPGIDVLHVSTTVTHLASTWSSSETHAELMALPRAKYDPADLAALPRLASALVYAKTRQIDVASVTTTARLSPEVADAARTTRQRMLRAAEYHLDDDAVVATRIASIREGSGWNDTAVDLRRLAALYTENVERFPAQSDRHYFPGDAAKALELAAAIFSAVAPEEPQKAWSVRVAKLWSLMEKRYAPVRAAVTFVTGSEAPALTQLRRPAQASEKAEGEKAKETEKPASEKGGEKPAEEKASGETKPAGGDANAIA